MVIGSELEICSRGYSCCTADMEQNLDKHSRRDFAQRLANTTEFSRASLITATAKFNGESLAISFKVSTFSNCEYNIFSMVFTIAYSKKIWPVERKGLLDFPSLSFENKK